MQMSGEQRIEAPRERVWAALNDPEVLRQCIPGCQSLEKESDERMKATVEIKIGPIGAKFNGAVTLSDINPPESYTITGQGTGGTVGSAKGGARVRLAEAGNATVLSYDVDAEVGGRLAQLGGPIIDATAKQLSAKFFKQFAAVVEGPGETPAAITPSVAATAATTAASTAAPVPAPTYQPTVAPAYQPPAPAPASPGGWIAAVVLALLAGFYIGLERVDLGWVIGAAVVVVVAAAAAYQSGKRAGGGS